LDEVDREIIRQLIEGPLTTTELARKMFDLKDVHDLRKETSFLRYRLGKLVDEGILAYNRKSKMYDIICDYSVGHGVVQLYSVNYQNEITLVDSLTSGPTIFVYASEGTMIIFLTEPRENASDLQG
jgi:hypothetical protein